MRKLTSFNTKEAEEKYSAQIEKTKGVYAKMLVDSGYTESEECAEDLTKIADEILQEEYKMGKRTDVDAALSETMGARTYFDSFSVGEIVGVNSEVVPDTLDETTEENLKLRNKARGRATYNAKSDKISGLRTAKIVAKTRYTLTVEYVSMHPTSFFTSALSTPWRESFSWNQLESIYKLQR